MRTGSPRPIHDRSAPCRENRLYLNSRLRLDAAFWLWRGTGYRLGTDIADLAICATRCPELNGDLEPGVVLTLARLGGEWLCLVNLKIPVAVAGLAAARAAALFARSEHVPDASILDWIAPMAADIPPSVDQLHGISQRLIHHWHGASTTLAKTDAQRIVRLWPLLGNCETLMETGGDIRLLRDPQTDLNGYGCSHRPRPWAITFASSTASSVSERGYEAADRTRIRVTARLIKAGNRSAILAEAAAVRAAIGRAFGLKRGSAVVLAASGTDSELLTLALSHLVGDDRPITTILLAPEETGTGVPMAAMGRHFAIDTANGHDVSRAAPIDGFRADTNLVSIPLRNAHGDVRALDQVEANICEAVTAAQAEGRRVILHALDLSKTGLLAPSIQFLHRLRAQFENDLDIVVDACQMRIAPERIAEYLHLGAVVQVTGSKFLTGPPFAGAVLVPPVVAARLAKSEARLPAGLDAYFSQGEWPQKSPVARGLPEGANYGLLLRWRAALAEYRAFAAVDDARKETAITRFGAVVRREIGRHNIFVLQTIPALQRAGSGWDRHRTIYAFAVRRSHHDDALLDPATMRKLYRWLNADCTALFETTKERKIAGRICHIGQPVALPDSAGGQIGWLRVSAGARLISGEPSLRYLKVEQRLNREMRDLKAVFDKIELLRRNWPRLDATDPVAVY